MLIHTVMWKIKNDEGGSTNTNNCLKIKGLLEGLRSTIPEISSMSVGIQGFPDSTAWDMVLHTTFDDYQALLAYQNHPDHLAVASVIGSLRTERAVVDFEI